MQQYYELKKQNQGTVLFFRLGDFYEMFDDDAKEISALLGITLTARNGIPMCGVPYHAAANYISRLLKEGKKIAVCEQTSVIPDPATKIVPRKIVRIITPGTVLEDAMLDSKNSNYLVSLVLKDNGWGLGCIEASTADFWVTQNDDDPDFLALASVLSTVNPSELLAEREAVAKLRTKIILPADLTVSDTPPFVNNEAPDSWPSSLEAHEAALKAGLNCIKYLAITNTEFKDYYVPYYRCITDYLQLDNAAVGALELIASQSGRRKNTLWGVLDYTQTPMASRMLKEWILRPLLDIEHIKNRQENIKALLKDEGARDELAFILKEFSDVDRIMSRVASSSALPRDLAGLRSSLLLVDRLVAWTQKHPDLLPALNELLKDNLPQLKEVSKLLYDSLNETQPVKLSDGNIIKEGYNAELDELRKLKSNAAAVLQEICQREREKTGIPTMKIGFNNVFGYYLEVSKAHAAKVPYDYTRKQTLANGERYITEELKNLERKILSAEERILRIELSVFEEIKKTLCASLDLLRHFAKTIAKADCYYSLAVAAQYNNFVCPVLLPQGGPLVIENGRHPIVEQTIPAGSFVPNNLYLGGDGPQIMLITGPNMGGKSVFLKQSALIIIMAQLGSFVPASAAQIGITDKILTRIGAQDALSQGRSTFMVEMKETADILACATPHSLILLDEVGRGTSTFDGISIAWALAEFLHKSQGSGTKVLFATHYFELTELEGKYPKIKNFHVAAREYKTPEGDIKLNFLFKIAEGAADKSYGIHVAELAGLPPSCILRARKILKDLESKQDTGIITKESRPIDLFSNPIVEEIKILDTDKITPLQAMQIISEWKKRIE